MTQDAPAVTALAASPVILMPPSAMSGTPAAWVTLATSIMAVSWGIPTPVTTRVVQMLPGPIPTFTASAPQSIRSLAASAVAMLPATTSTSGKLFLSQVSASIIPLECPWALSSTRASTSAATNAEARSCRSWDTPTAAATRKRPRLSLAAWGYSSFLIMSLMVMSPCSM